MTDSFQVEQRLSSKSVVPVNLDQDRRGSVNQHIRFLSEESDISDFSDSLKNSVGDKRRILKVRQRNRNKKKIHFFG